jgi:hypothetical protein
MFTLCRDADVFSSVPPFPVVRLPDATHAWLSWHPKMLEPYLSFTPTSHNTYTHSLSGTTRNLQQEVRRPNHTSPSEPDQTSSPPKQTRQDKRPDVPPSKKVSSRGMDPRSHNDTHQVPPRPIDSQQAGLSSHLCWPMDSSTPTITSLLARTNSKPANPAATQAKLILHETRAFSIPARRSSCFSIFASSAVP